VARLAEHLALRDLGLAALLRPAPHAMRDLVRRIAVIDLETVGASAPATPPAKADDRLTSAAL